MNLETFLKYNNFVLQPKVLGFCQKGLTRMENSKDPLHDINHVNRLIDNLNSFLKEEKKAREKADLEVLLTTICWHDSWLANRKLKSVFSFVFRSLNDGLSTFSFIKGAVTARLKIKLIIKAAFCILVHPNFSPVPEFTLESKIFIDIDSLDEWSLERLEIFDKLFIQKQKPYLLKMIRWYFNNFMAKKSPSSFYFKWTQEQFEKVKKDYLRKANYYLDVSTPHVRCVQ